MKKPVHQVIRINERGASRVLDGKAGMTFVVENWVGVDDRCAAVLDYRYPNPQAVGGYQSWTIAPDGFEIVQDAPDEAAAAEPYLVWSNEHGAWWRANHCGYTVHLDAAGRYPREEAQAISRNARDGWRPGAPPPEIPVREADALACLRDDRGEPA